MTQPLIWRFFENIKKWSKVDVSCGDNREMVRNLNPREEGLRKKNNRALAEFVSYEQCISSEKIAIINRKKTQTLTLLKTLNLKNWDIISER